MKKVSLIILSIIMLCCMENSVFAGELNVNERSVLEAISKDGFPQKIEQRYLNQLENYFCTDNVQIGKSEADDFVMYLKEAINAKKNAQKEKNFKNISETYIYFQKAGTAIDLLLEYDSSVNNFYFIDGSGYIVLDFENVIKNTDNAGKDHWNFSVEIVFSGIIVLCILGMLVNLRRWNKKIKRHNRERYDSEDEDEDELEVANRKTRKARMQTFSYRNIKQILKYCYIPIIMGIIVIAIGALSLSHFGDVLSSMRTNFINTQPLYHSKENLYRPATVKAVEQPKSIRLSKISYPRYSEQYGQLKCTELKVDAPVYFGDRGAYLDSGAGTYSGSAVPGQGKTILIGAHDTTFFKGLENVKKGQKFVFTTTYGIYEYQVRETKVYHAGDYENGYDLKAGKEELVLYTCYPFGRLNGEKSDRLFVYLDRIAGPSIEY
ncbi:MAG: class D sortase [Eubacterium sp.]|nr:class D sortase [Eubacterium sp.]